MECVRCGVIFARYRARVEATPKDAPEVEPERPRPGLFRRIYRIGRWVSLAGSVVVIGLVLRSTTPPSIELSAQATERARLKVGEFQDGARQGRNATLKLDRSELNGWLDANLAIGAAPAAASKTVPAPAPGPSTKAAAAPEPEPTVAEVQSNVRDVKIDLLDDRLRAYVVFELYGKLLSLMLEGKLRAEAGYLRFEPTGAMLGSLPLPESTLQNAAHRIFDSPENREKFRLPPEIATVKVDRGLLVISTRRSDLY